MLSTVFQVPLQPGPLFLHEPGNFPLGHPPGAADQNLPAGGDFQREGFPGRTDYVIENVHQIKCVLNRLNLRYIDKILYEWGKLGIKTAKDVEKHRKKRAQRKEEEADSNIDLDIVDWDWFDDDE